MSNWREPELTEANVINISLDRVISLGTRLIIVCCSNGIKGNQRGKRIQLTTVVLVTNTLILE